MSNENGLNTENILRSFPDVLLDDAKMSAIAASIANVFSALDNNVGLVKIYPKVDDLPEELLDILAYDFKIDWWDPNCTLAEKRQVFKDNWRTHQKLGTKAAVEQALSTIYQDTIIREWPEYGGEPYHFKIISGNPAVTNEKVEQFMRLLNITKRESAWLDSVLIALTGEMHLHMGCCTKETSYEKHTAS